MAAFTFLPWWYRVAAQEIIRARDNKTARRNRSLSMKIALPTLKGDLRSGGHRHLSTISDQRRSVRFAGLRRCDLVPSSTGKP